MGLITILIIFLLLIICILAILLIISIRKHNSTNDSSLFAEKLKTLEFSVNRIENSIKSEFSTNRLENNKTAQEQRRELSESLSIFSKQFSENTKDLNSLLRERFTDFYQQMTISNKNLLDSIKEMRDIVDKQLKSLRDENKQQLEEMRITVDEKLQKTLNDRLSHSFETVNKQLQAVQEGLGEMKNIATDVGGLKKVLSNVKMRGTIGEIQLSMLLEQILAPDQYEANVKTVPSSSNSVEFAVKLPGKGSDKKVVYLPIDAKFPKDIYEQLLDAYDSGNSEEIIQAQKNLENTIKKMAKDISEKYLAPPHTTDFGIMFLPFEGIYAEVVRQSSLLDELQRKHKIIITGPSTLAAILNSLQMGFRTLAIQKRSSEVWNVLNSVKTEFGKFETMMNKAKRNFQTGLNQLDQVIGTRTKAIVRQLDKVESLDYSPKNDNKVLDE